jgi:6-methylsalicylate decarboxylase
MRLDVHQHLWTASLVEALRRRRRPPFVRRDAGRYVVHLAGEAPSTLEVEDAQRRLATFERDGVDRVLLAISSPLGIEALPRAQARELIDAHLDGVLALGDRFGAWGPLALDGVEPGDVDALLERGCAGVSLPAGALLPSSVDALTAALTRLEELGAPLFIHPGPGLTRPGRGPAPGDPPWWPALTRYVGQMHQAWLTFSAYLRPSLPQLRVVYAMLAGLAPLQCERLSARGGPAIDLASAVDFYDSSSYGALAIDAMARCVGHTQLLYGSDRPVVEPPPNAGRDLGVNAAWLDLR